mmetsp:Transcript_83479/g.210421  ORF Transcript_83479/g.210421 Transcript_83479/m.210421 type:complete len:202 (-) Transcript_83479:188-793(-)
MGHVSESELAGDVTRVHAAKDELPLLLVAEVEAKHGLCQLPRLHEGLHHGGDPADGKLRETQAKHAVKWHPGPVPEPAGVVHLCECKVRQGHLTDGDRVLTEEARDVSGAVADLEDHAGAHMRGGHAEVVKLAAARRLRRNPEVRRTRVEDDSELLPWLSHSDLTVVGHVLVVAEDHLFLDPLAPLAGAQLRCQTEQHLRP